MTKRTLKSLIVALAVFAVIPVANGLAKPTSSPSPGPVVSEKLAGLTSPSFGPTGDELRALMLRSEALNQKYGLGQFAHPRPPVSEIVGGLGPTTQPQTTVSVSTGNEFDWADAGIGAGVVSAALIAAMAATLAVRGRSRHGRLAH